MPFPRADPAATAVVTGASSGIGAELARLLARDGFNLAIVARREERLRSLAGELEREHGVHVEVLARDLTDPGQRAALARDVPLRADVLVNNAGFATGGPFHESDLEQELHQVRLLCEAPADLMRRFLPGMVERRCGAVLNVTSTAGMQPLPNSAGYGAAKAYLLSLSEAVHAELRRHGVHVTALCPPPVHTELFEKEDHPVERVPRFAWLEADEVARAGLAGVKANKRVVIPGTVARVASPIARFAPRAIQLRLLERAFRT
jgi:short-subunit dehydrogenase